MVLSCHKTRSSAVKNVPLPPVCLGKDGVRSDRRFSQTFTVYVLDSDCWKYMAVRGLGRLSSPNPTGLPEMTGKLCPMIRHS